ncbi:amidinotransferase [Pedobacter sp. SD-b]|uniref:arginine deiminase n=1 Tax=Pedobacter segetis TaxID=2793069 RepID=A0ABS1BHR8_9SPHI|nr:arginine deiminase family protein [Pedobacter segetis]MBK0382428.1 amidinotransferase [Pedobacter segetis]
MSETFNDFKVNVGSEIGALRCLIIHSPDSGLGKVVPSKAQDWLFEDIVHLKTIRKNEYDHYLKLLLYFLDTEKIQGKLKDLDKDLSRDFYKPGHPKFHNSLKVVELQKLLSDILINENIKHKLVASVCAMESCTYHLQNQLMAKSNTELANIIISGSMDNDRMIFAPIPNFIFTRDVAIIINNFVLLNKPAKKARFRETLIARYIFFNHPLFASYEDNILEIPDSLPQFLRPGEENEQHSTLEGGDVMVVAKNHLLIGFSERTSAAAINETIKMLFDRNVVEKVTVVKIPHKRDFMHLDTVFTQVKKNMWVILKSIAMIDHRGNGNEPIDHITEKQPEDRTEVTQFIKGKINQPIKFDSVEQLLADISENDLKSTEKTEIIYSGNEEFPYDSREQWTDSCNLLALKEGVVLGYDRNEHTINAFKQKGFRIIGVKDLLQKFEIGELNPRTLENTFITMPSAELSRARGGFHCMSMPVFRDELVD